MSTESLPQPAYAVAPCNDGSRLPAGVVAFEIDSGDGSGDASTNVAFGLKVLPRLPRLLEVRPSPANRLLLHLPPRAVRFRAFCSSSLICAWALPNSRKMTAKSARHRGRASVRTRASVRGQSTCEGQRVEGRDLSDGADK